MARRSKPRTATLGSLSDWIGATILPGEAHIGRYQQRYDWPELLALAQGLPMTLARMNARVMASQTLKLYCDKGTQSSPTAKIGRKRLDYLRSGMAGHKAAEWATMGGDAEEVVDHPVLRLLNRPSPFHTGRQVFELGFVYRQLVGNSFDQVVMGMVNGTAAPQWLVPMNPAYVTIQPDEVDFISGYWYDRSRTDGQWLDRREVLHLQWSRSEIDPYAGTGWLDNVRAEARLLATDAGFDIAFAERGYQPPFAVQYDESFNEARAKESVEFFRKTFSGWSKMVTPLFLWKAKYVPTQPVPKDLQTVEKVRDRQLAIMAAAGVPESMYRLNDANLASSQQGYSVQYLDATVRPAINAHAEQLTEFLLPLYGVSPGEMWFAYDNPVPENEQADADLMLREVAAGVLTVDEYRDHFGREPLPKKPATPILSDFPVVGGDPTGNGSQLGGGIDIPPQFKALPMPIKADVDIRKIKAWGIWDAPDCCHRHVEKAASPSEFESELARWYERTIAEQAGAIARGQPLAFESGDVERIFARYLTELMGQVATSEADQIGASAGDFSVDIQRVLTGYLPTLSQQIRLTTTQRLDEIRQAVTDALMTESGRGGSIEDVQREITRLAPEEAGYLAERVARTETAYASTQASMLAWRRANVDEKDWLLAPGACPVCADLHAKRPRVKANEPFARAGETFGGYTLRRDCYGPPVHPNDRCSFAPVVRGFDDVNA